MAMLNFRAQKTVVAMANATLLRVVFVNAKLGGGHLRIAASALAQVIALNMGYATKLPKNAYVIMLG